MNAVTTDESLNLVESPRRAPAVQQTTAVAVSSPETFIFGLMERGATFDQVERAMAWRKELAADAARNAYNAAFSGFKGEAVRIARAKEVAAGPLKGGRYAELYSVVDAVTPALSAHGLSAAWRITRDEKDWIEVTCVLRHTDGHSETVSMGGPPDAGGAKNAIQARASTVSYLSRYTLKAILGVAEGGEDNDGASDSGAAPAQPGEQAAPSTDAYPQDRFDKNFASWRDLIVAGGKTADEVIRTVEKRGALSDAQKTQIRNVGRTA